MRLLDETNAELFGKGDVLQKFMTPDVEPKVHRLSGANLAYKMNKAPPINIAKELRQLN